MALEVEVVPNPKDLPRNRRINDRPSVLVDPTLPFSEEVALKRITDLLKNGTADWQSLHAEVSQQINFSKAEPLYIKSGTSEELSINLPQI